MSKKFIKKLNSNKMLIIFLPVYYFSLIYKVSSCLGLSVLDYNAGAHKHTQMFNASPVAHVHSAGWRSLRLQPVARLPLSWEKKCRCSCSRCAVMVAGNRFSHRTFKTREGRWGVGRGGAVSRLCFPHIPHTHTLYIHTHKQASCRRFICGVLFSAGPLSL